MSNDASQSSTLVMLFNFGDRPHLALLFGSLGLVVLD